MTRLTDHLIVISFDCLSELDVPLLRSLPNFKGFIQRSSFCSKVETIYPSLTYPCHTTIVTGNYPNKHRIINNTFIQPGKRSPDWYWHRSYIHGTTLYDEAKKKGMTTAALLWPVTAKAKIDYNMPEIFPNRPWQHQIPVSLANGSPLYQIKMNSKFGHLRNGVEQPELDDYVLESAVETIRTKKPGLMLIHFVDLDAQRHMFGFSSQQAREAISRHDQRLGRILEAIREAGIESNSTIAILGDHSSLDESKMIKLNVLFKEKGLIQTDKNGKVLSWKAYCKSCDGSAYIYLKDLYDKEIEETVSELLESLLQNPDHGIEKCLTGIEAEKLGADGKAFRMLEASHGFYFSEDLNGPFLEDVQAELAKKKIHTLACHGYSPKKKNYHTVFFVSGKGIKSGIEIPSMHLVDEGPTFARLLGLNLGETDGNILEEVLDQKNTN